MLAADERYFFEDFRYLSLLNEHLQRLHLLGLRVAGLNGKDGTIIKA